MRSSLVRFSSKTAYFDRAPTAADLSSHSGGYRGGVLLSCSDLSPPRACEEERFTLRLAAEPFDRGFVEQRRRKEGAFVLGFAGALGAYGASSSRRTTCTR